MEDLERGTWRLSASWRGAQVVPGAVVEIGAAAGLPCLVSAALGAAAALGTDVDANGVAQIEAAAAHNGLGVRAARLDWFDFLATPPAETAGSGSEADVVLAADVNYQTGRVVDALLATITALLAPGTRKEFQCHAIRICRQSGGAILACARACARGSARVHTHITHTYI